MVLGTDEHTPKRSAAAVASWSRRGSSWAAATTTVPISTIRSGTIPWYGFAYGQYPWGPYGYPPYRTYRVDPGASLRLEVKPKEAEVYVDGFYAGIVDDFDGTFQRLSVTPGEHDIELFWMATARCIRRCT